VHRVIGPGCATGLACDPVAKKCAAIVYNATGTDCDDIVRRCERGRCEGEKISSTDGTTTVTPGKCTEPLADGATCDVKATTGPRCDEFASCIGGKCTLPDANACK